MGFREGAYARVWNVDNQGNYSTGNVTVSRKDKESGEYKVEFTDGFVRFVGSAHEDINELGLPTKDEYDSRNDRGVTIKISSCDVTNRYSEKTGKMYTNYTIFGFEIPDDDGGNRKSRKSDKKTTKNAAKSKPKKPARARDFEEVDEDDDEDLPF